MVGTNRFAQTVVSTVFLGSLVLGWKTGICVVFWEVAVSISGSELQHIAIETLKENPQKCRKCNCLRR